MTHFNADSLAQLGASGHKERVATRICDQLGSRGLRKQYLLKLRPLATHRMLILLDLRTRLHANTHIICLCAKKWQKLVIRVNLVRVISAVGHGKLLCKEIGNQVRGDMVQILLHAFTETTCMSQQLKICTCNIYRNYSWTQLFRTMCTKLAKQTVPRNGGTSFNQGTF